MTKSNFKMKKRIMFMFFTVAFLSSALVLRLGFIMIVQGEDLKKQALEQQTRDRLITPKRGTIFDRNGKPLAVSASVETVSISPVTVRKSGDVEKYSQYLAQVLGMDQETIKGKMNKNTSYEIIKRKVEKEVADGIREQQMKGVYLDEDSKRYYPYKNFASHIIGFTGVDNQGLLGIEMVYDKVLSGKPGRVIGAKNADGTEMPYKYDRYYQAEDGSDIVLTIDQTIQHFLEKHMEQAVADENLQAGAAGIVIDVKSGEILAMTTKGDFDLNDPFKLSDKANAKIAAITDENERKKAQSDELQKMWRNKAVVDSYEPGSTFKMLVASMALEENVVKMSDTFTCTGSLKVGKHTIRCWKSGGHGTLDFKGALENSCNPAFMTIGARVGQELFTKYYKGFGMDKITGVELPGETAGIFFRPQDFNTVELATSSFGQGFQVTPLQMVAAMGAIANDGYLMKPHLIKNFIDQDGNVTDVVEPTVIRQVISEETSKQMCELLEGVVGEGSGSNAFIDGYHIAGKTGTSEKQPRGNGKYVSSFAGFAPANDPQVALLIILDEPNGNAYYGGQIAAPVAKKIFEDTLRYLGVEPDLDPSKIAPEQQVPQVTSMSVKDAKSALTKLNLTYRIEGGGEVILDQVPKANVRVAEGSTVILYTTTDRINNNTPVPNLIGLTYQQAEAKLKGSGLNIAVQHMTPSDKQAYVKTQSPKPGTMVQQGSIVNVEVEYKDLYR